MARYGILVDYEWCSGCHTCEVACQMGHGLPTDRFGAKLFELGPWQMGEKNWQHANVPLFSKECDLCRERTEKGKLPACVAHCQAKCLTYGPVAELASELEKKPQQLLIVP